MSEHPQYIEIYLRESYGKESRENMRRALGMSNEELDFHIARIKKSAGRVKKQRAPISISGVLPSKAREQRKLDEDKAKFLAAGGQIKQIPGFTEVKRKL